MKMIVITKVQLMSLIVRAVKTAFISPKVDKLSCYLFMDIDKTILTDSPLEFWRRNQTFSGSCSS